MSCTFVPVICFRYVFGNFTIETFSFINQLGDTQKFIYDTICSLDHATTNIQGLDKVADSSFFLLQKTWFFKNFFLNPFMPLPAFIMCGFADTYSSVIEYSTVPLNNAQFLKSYSIGIHIVASYLVQNFRKVAKTFWKGSKTVYIDFGKVPNRMPKFVNKNFVKLENVVTRGYQYRETQLRTLDCRRS